MARMKILPRQASDNLLRECGYEVKAMDNVNAELLERTARAMQGANALRMLRREPWDEVSETEREHWLFLANAALRASGHGAGREALEACREYLVEITKPPRVGAFAGVVSSYHPCHALIHKIDAALSTTVALERTAGRDMPKWLHKKRGSIVTEIARGFAQVAVHPIEEMTAVVIYRHDADGIYWVRNAVEFDDGRFEPLAPSPDDQPEKQA